MCQAFCNFDFKKLRIGLKTYSLVNKNTLNLDNKIQKYVWISEAKEDGHLKIGKIVVPCCSFIIQRTLRMGKLNKDLLAWETNTNIGTIFFVTKTIIKSI